MDIKLKGRSPGMSKLLLAAGTKAKIAQDTGLTRQCVGSWFNKDGHVPIKWLTTIEALYGIPRIELIDPSLLDHTNPVNFDGE